MKKGKKDKEEEESAGNFSICNKTNFTLTVEYEHKKVLHIN